MKDLCLLWAFKYFWNAQKNNMKKIMKPLPRKFSRIKSLLTTLTERKICSLAFEYCLKIEFASLNQFRCTTIFCQVHF